MIARILTDYTISACVISAVFVALMIRRARVLTPPPPPAEPALPPISCTVYTTRGEGRHRTQGEWKSTLEAENMDKLMGVILWDLECAGWKMRAGEKRRVA